MADVYSNPYLRTILVIKQKWNVSLIKSLHPNWLMIHAKNKRVGYAPKLLGNR